MSFGCNVIKNWKKKRKNFFVHQFVSSLVTHCICVTAPTIRILNFILVDMIFAKHRAYHLKRMKTTERRRRRRGASCTFCVIVISFSLFHRLYSISRIYIQFSPTWSQNMCTNNHNLFKQAPQIQMCKSENTLDRFDG